MSRRLQPLRYLLYSLPLLFLAGFFFYPLLRILRLSLGTASSGPGIGVQWGVITELLGARFFWQLLWFTTWQAAASTALTVALGLPLAYLFAHYAFPGKSILRALTTIPFVMPTVVVAAAFTALIGRQGIVNLWLQQQLLLDEPPLQLLQTIWIILIAHAFYNVSVIVRTVGGFWSALNPRLREAGAVLGAAPWQLFWEVTLPLLLPSITASGLLVFLFCFTSFGVVLILGGLAFATIEVEIYRQAVNLFNLPVAAFLSLVQMALTFSVMAVYTRLQARLSLPLELQPATRIARRPHGRQWIWVSGGLLLMVLILLGPLLALAWRSFTLGGAGWTTTYYQELTINRRQSAFFVPPIVAVRNSLLFATATMVLSLFLGVVSAYLLARPRNWVTAILDPIFLLPLGTSAVTLGFGYIVALGALRTSLILVPIAHTLIAAPFVLRTFLPALRSLDPRLRSGGSDGRTALARLVGSRCPNFAAGAAGQRHLCFTVSLGEFGATLLVSRPDTPTMPIVIYRAGTTRAA
ncbi:MAG: iron ABC transporter permease [Caldilineaceae bacterium]